MCAACRAGGAAQEELTRAQVQRVRSPPSTRGRRVRGFARNQGGLCWCVCTMQASRAAGQPDNAGPSGQNDSLEDIEADVKGLREQVKQLGPASRPPALSDTADQLHVIAQLLASMQPRQESE